MVIFPNREGDRNPPSKNKPHISGRIISFWWDGKYQHGYAEEGEEFGVAEWVFEKMQEKEKYA